MHQQSFSFSPGFELDSSFSTSYSYPEPQPSLMDVSISTITNKAAKIKDSLWNYFGIQKIIERQDPRYQQLLQYVDSIKDDVAVFQKNKYKKEQNKIQAIKNADQCYNTIPNKYFNQSFELILARKKAQQIKLEQSEYLDQIDETLFSIVNANFSKYMAPMMEIQQMDKSTEVLLKKINKGRDQLMKMENQFVYKAIKTRKMSYISHNLTKLVTILNYIQKLKALPEKINTCISQGKCDYDIFTQLQQTEQQERLCEQLQCLKGTSTKLNQLKQELKMYLIGLFDSSLYRYINGMLIYSRDKWIDSGLKVEENNTEQSFNTDITILNISQIDLKETEDVQEDLTLKKQLIDMVFLCSKLKISIGRFGRKLSQRLENFAQGFQEDLNEYLIETLNIVNNQHMDLGKCLQMIQMKHYVKISLSYFGILKNLFQKLVHLYNYGNQSIEFDQILSPFRLFIIQQIKLFMSYKKLPPDVDASQFSSYLSLMDYWISAENNQLPQLQLSVLEQSKNQLLVIYLKNFNEVTINGQLKQTIQSDNFQPTSIPAEYYVQFQNMFNPNTADESLMLQNTFNRSSRKQKNKTKNFKQNSSNCVRLLNKQINVNGQSYRVCSSFLLLLEIIQEYAQMSHNLKSCQNILESKTIQVIKFYNDETRRMILGGEIVNYKKISQVSIRHLCLLAKVLCFLRLILSKLCFKDKLSKHKIEQSITSHINDICKQISTVVFSRLDNQASSLFQTGQIKNVLGKKAPCNQSQRVIEIFTKVKNILVEYWDINTTRQILKAGFKSIQGLYFKALKNESQRGRQEIRWVMIELEVNLGKGFQEQLKHLNKLWN